jgi:hypothetical protein
MKKDEMKNNLFLIIVIALVTGTIIGAALMAGAFINFSKPVPMIIMLMAAFILGCVGDRLNRTLRKQIDEEVKEA